MSILDSAELLMQAKNYSGTGNWLDETANSHDGVNNGALFKDFLTDSLQYLYVPISNNGASTPDSVALSLTGDFDFRVRLAMDDYTPAATGHIITKRVAVWSFRFEVTTGGNLKLWWSEDGSATKNETSSVATGLTDGTIAWIRVTMDVDNGASDSDIKFWTSTTDTNDHTAVVWSQLGTTQNSGAATSIHDSADEVEFGGAGGTNANPIIGAYYRIVMMNGIDGTVVFDADFTDTAVVTPPYATFAEKSSNAATVTIERKSSGKVATIVNRNMWLLSTDDFFEVADDAGLDFSGSQDLTVMAVFMTNTVAAGSDILVAKKDDLTTSAGYALLRNATNSRALLGDGTDTNEDDKATIAIHTLHTAAMVRNTTDDDSHAFLDGVGSGSATTDDTNDTLANALPLRIGATSGTAGSFWEGIIVAVAVWRSALTDIQVADAHTLLTTEVAAGYPHNRNVTAGQLLLTG